MGGRRQQVTLTPAVLSWARQRVDCEIAELADKIGVEPADVEEWERSGEIRVTHVAKLSHKTHTPLGFLYLSEPPEGMDRLPIPDFRSRNDNLKAHPSPDLLETVQTMQRRQAWMREELLYAGADSVSVVGSFGLEHPHDEVAQAMRGYLGLEKNWAAQKNNWSNALRYLRKRIEESRILIMLNGIVGNNTRRKLNSDEFQGFALVDEYAPLIFVNSADHIVAQMFTFAHELAHIFIGEAGVSKFNLLRRTEQAVEKFCDKVAAEFLVPEKDLREYFSNVSNDDPDRYEKVARQFKVSTIVAARRMLDLGLISREIFFDFYSEWEQTKRNEKKNGAGGGNFWNTQNVRIGRPFGAAIDRAVGEDRLFYREAYNLTGFKSKTFDKYIKKINGQW